MSNRTLSVLQPVYFCYTNKIMRPIRTITIIYNPVSTGKSRQNALALKRTLTKDYNVSLIATDHPGHAQEIAAAITAKRDPHIIMCSSGDGGYNEVINGVLSHKHHRHIVTAVIPSGNANDHYRELSTNKSLLERIKTQDFETIDALLLKTSDVQRYAHSYIGFGVTPHIGQELTKQKLNPLKEVWIVLKNLFTVRPVKVQWDGRHERYDNLIFSNVQRMSKVMKLTDSASLRDGKFEIIANKSRSVATLIQHLLHASTLGLGTQKRAKTVNFILDRDTQVQLDGEVMLLKKQSHVTIQIEPKTLRCVA